jgi:hypothetical protein
MASSPSRFSRRGQVALPSPRDAAPTDLIPPSDQGRRQRRRSIFWSLGAVLASAAAVGWSHLRRPPDTEWTAVVLWAVSVAAMALACRTPGERPRVWWRWPPTRDGVAAVAVLALSAAVLLPGLEQYPLEVAGDPTRDGGLLALRILRGEVKEVFQYSFFNGFTWFAPLTGVPFLLMFGSLSFKVQAALEGMAAALLVFMLARRYLPLVQSFAAAVALLSMPIFLFYSRLESLVAFNPPLTLLVLAALLRVLEQEAMPRTFGMLGLVAGITCLFHAGAKSAGLAALALAGGFAAWRTLLRRQPLRRLAAGAVASVAGILVGLGPLLLVTNPSLLLSTEKFSSTSRGLDVGALFDAYQHSLRVFFDQPIAFRFPVMEPLIPSVILAALFGLGAVLGFLSVPRHVHGTLLYYVLLLPLTNSAMTDARNSAHRLLPLLPIAALLIAIGIDLLWRGVGVVRPAALRPWLRAVVLGAAALGAGDQVYRFFAEEQGRTRDQVVPHLMYFALHEIKETPVLRDAPVVCVSSSRSVWTTLDYAHFKEGWAYYLPEQKVQLEVMPTPVRDSELYLSTSCSRSPPPGGWVERRFCSPRQRFVCPGEETRVAELRIMVDPRPAPPVGSFTSAPTDPSGASTDQERRRLANTVPGRAGLLPWRGGSTLLDLAALLQSKEVEVEVNDPTFAPQVAALFDGATGPPIRTNSINPLIITLKFRSPIKLRWARGVFAASPHDWALEPVPGGPRYAATNVPAGKWSRIGLPEATTTSVVRFEILRLERDDYVHVGELELWAQR